MSNQAQKGADASEFFAALEQKKVKRKKDGPQLSIPDGMSDEEAFKQLKATIARRNVANQTIAVVEFIDCLPFDGAAALMRVLARDYEFVDHTPTPGFFGPNPPQLIAVDVAVGEKINVPWGRFVLPDIDGWVQTNVHFNDKGGAMLSLSSEVKRGSEPRLRELFASVRKEVAENSLYRGKAISIRFKDDDGEQIGSPMPKFMDVANLSPASLIFSRDIEADINASLFTPIRRYNDLAANGISLKRGILLGGIFGTGKTLAASVAAKLAEQAGQTFIYIKHADELSMAIELGKRYQSPACVIFCEDIDRSLSGNRSVAMDDILNTIDGIDSKNSNIMVILTSNDMSQINPAMLRPGRIDHVINVLPPDAEAVARLLRLYGGDLIWNDTDLTDVARNLSGQIPAVIAEVVKRAKLFEIARIAPGELIHKITADALLAAAKTMEFQIGLQRANMEKAPVTDNALEGVLVEIIRRAIASQPTHFNGHEAATHTNTVETKGMVRDIGKTLKAIAEHVKAE